MTIGSRLRARSRSGCGPRFGARRLIAEAGKERCQPASENTVAKTIPTSADTGEWRQASDFSEVLHPPCAVKQADHESQQDRGAQAAGMAAAPARPSNAPTVAWYEAGPRWEARRCGPGPVPAIIGRARRAFLPGLQPNTPTDLPA